MPRGTNATVLIVDNDRGVRTLVQGLLEREGYATLTAESTEEAMVLFREHKASIALLVTDTDIVSGREFARRIQRIKPNLGVLVMSACRGQCDKAFEGFAWLLKPFTIRELLGRVVELLPQNEGGKRKRPSQIVVPPGSRRGPGGNC